MSKQLSEDRGLGSRHTCAMTMARMLRESITRVESKRAPDRRFHWMIKRFSFQGCACRLHDFDRLLGILLYSQTSTSIYISCSSTKESDIAIISEHGASLKRFKAHMKSMTADRSSLMESIAFYRSPGYSWPPCHLAKLDVLFSGQS